MGSAAGIAVAAGGGSALVSAVVSVGALRGAAAGSVFVSVLACDGAATARTAAWQAGARLAMFFFRHCSDAAPPGGMLAQCAL
jgi:hypothetical protein